jgi:hypothetical protein
VTNEQLLAEVEDLLRTMPPRATIRQDLPENLSWLGRVSAVIANWSPPNSALLRIYVSAFHRPDPGVANENLKKIVTLLNEARYDLRMKTAGPISVAVSQGLVFDYFDEIRKIIEIAKQDVLFVDPYLDAEFVSRYLSHISNGVTVRLLAREKLTTLLPAVDLFTKQSTLKIEVRSAPNFHDRYVFVDRTECYQSGASFKDGAKSAPTTLTQITDAFAAMSQTYEAIWNGAKIER